MYKGILHTHFLSVALFLLLYVVKTVLLLANQHSALQAVTDKTKWAERIISVLFLGTGIYLYFNSGNITWMLHLKIALVFASIPLAIIGFKRKKAVLAVISLLFLFGAYGLAEMNKKQATKVERPAVVIAANEMEAGKALYTAYCVVCHGEDGTAGLSGATNLRLSTKTKEEKESFIRIGKGAMPAFSNLSDSEIDALLLYTDSFVER